MQKTYIVLRQSPNWNTISEEDFKKQAREFCISLRRPPEQVNMSVDLWNRTFNRSFLSVRQEIKEITLANFGCVENAEVLYDSEAAIVANQEEGFYIFTDDDDWLHPQLANLLSNIDNDQVNGFVWGSAAFGTHRPEKIITRRKSDGFCFTNNYAIAGRYLKQNPKYYHDVFQHGGANRVLKQSSAKIIKDYWSITNKNPTSTNYMGHVLKGSYSSSLLVGAIEEYVGRCERIDAEIDPSLMWARPQMSEMARLFSELL